MAGKEKTEASPADGAAEIEGAPKRGGRKKLILLAVPVLLAGLGAGLWFGGVLPRMLGMAQEEQHAEAAQTAPPAAPQPAFVDLPEIVSNLNAPGRRASYVRLKAKLEIANQQDLGAVNSAMPRLVDLFATYLREVRPDELRGSAGSHRLREELIARASIAAAPARVTDVLFVEILVQ